MQRSGTRCWCDQHDNRNRQSGNLLLGIGVQPPHALGPMAFCGALAHRVCCMDRGESPRNNCGACTRCAEVSWPSPRTATLHSLANRPLHVQRPSEQFFLLGWFVVDELPRRSGTFPRPFRICAGVAIPDFGTVASSGRIAGNDRLSLTHRPDLAWLQMDFAHCMASSTSTWLKIPRNLSPGGRAAGLTRIRCGFLTLELTSDRMRSLALGNDSLPTLSLGALGGGGSQL